MSDFTNKVQLVAIVGVIGFALLSVLANIIGYNIFSSMTTFGYIGWGSGILTGVVVMFGCFFIYQYLMKTA